MFGRLVVHPACGVSFSIPLSRKAPISTWFIWDLQGCCRWIAVIPTGPLWLDPPRPGLYHASQSPHPPPHSASTPAGVDSVRNCIRRPSSSNRFAFRVTFQQRAGHVLRERGGHRCFVKFNGFLFSKLASATPPRRHEGQDPRQRARSVPTLPWR